MDFQFSGNNGNIVSKALDTRYMYRCIRANEVSTSVSVTNKTLNDKTIVVSV